jgi:hypothetical protein
VLCPSDFLHSSVYNSANQENVTIQGEDMTIDFTEPDDLEEATDARQQRSLTAWAKLAVWEFGIGCALCFGVQLSNSLMGFPNSPKDAQRIIVGFFVSLIGVSILSAIAAFIDAFIREFRIRFRQTNHRLMEIEAQIESLQD